MTARLPRTALKRLAAAAVAAAVLGAGILELAAPQVYVLIREGFPGPTWPAAGDFAKVPGGAATPYPVAAGLSGAAQARFEAGGGRALLVWQDGQLTAEAYAAGITRETRLNSYSMVKSLVGALVLRAHAEGVLPDLDAPLSSLLEGPVPAVTLREVLTMTSGLDLGYEPSKPVDDGDFSPFGPLARLHAFGLPEILGDLDVDAGARGSFRYQSANTAVLGAVLEAAYDTPLPELLSDKIWVPAGAADAEWRLIPQGDGVSAYCCLYARPIDWVRVGAFLISNGQPDDPFLPAQVWHDFLLPELAPEVRRRGHYGQHIRHDVLDRAGATPQGPFAYAMGHGGQVLYLLPDRTAVVVRFGETPQLLHSTLYELLE